MTRQLQRPLRRGLAILLIAAVVYLGWTYYQSLPPPRPTMSRNGGVATVGVVKAGNKDIAILANGLGTVTPLATITVHTQISGIMQKIAFTEGQIVHKGDLLALIDPSPYEAALAQARGTLAHDQGVLAQAETDLKRYQTLSKQDSIARQQAEDQAYAVQQDRGTVAADLGAIQIQEVNIGFCHVTAPADGRVGLRQVDQGNYVTPSDTNGIVVLTQLQPISVIFTLPEDDIPQIQQQLDGKTTLPVDVYDRADTAKLASGTLAAMDTQIDPTTGTVKLRALFDNPKQTLFPSQFVNAHLLVATHRQAIAIPSAALQTGVNGNFVYKIDADDKVHVQTVKAGATNGDDTEILSGIEVGDTVVTDGTDRLRDGLTVTVATPRPKDGKEGGDQPKKHQHHHQQAEQAS